MKYMVDVERPVFFHFLNREAAHAAGRGQELLRDLLAIDIMLLTRVSASHALYISQAGVVADTIAAAAQGAAAG